MNLKITFSPHWSEPQGMRALLKRVVIVEPQSTLEPALLLLSAFRLLSAVRTEYGKSDLEYGYVAVFIWKICQT